jgi:hypothetical protein
MVKFLKVRAVHLFQGDGDWNAAPGRQARKSCVLHGGG